MKAFKPMNCTGSVLVLTTISLVLLLAVLGLAVDTGQAYGVKAKLNAAVDAAALAAAKAVAEGDDAAQAAARKYFTANIPEGYLRSDPQLTGVSISYNAVGDATIDVSATAPMLTTFLRVIGQDQYDVASTHRPSGARWIWLWWWTTPGRCGEGAHSATSLRTL
jgi:Flp pilus assembly protein TadG